MIGSGICIYVRKRIGKEMCFSRGLFLWFLLYSSTDLLSFLFFLLKLMKKEKSVYYVSCLGNLCYLTRGLCLYPPILYRIVGVKEVDKELYFIFKEN